MELATDSAAQEEERDGVRRHVITEILFFASVGDMKRLQALTEKHKIAVSTY